MMTVFISNLPPWVESVHLREWLAADNLTYIQLRLLRDKGIAFIDCGTAEMATRIIERFDSAPLEHSGPGDIRLLRASPAHTRPAMAGER
jgi:hypothetical protein